MTIKISLSIVLSLLAHGSVGLHARDHARDISALEPRDNVGECQLALLTLKATAFCSTFIVLQDVTKTATGEGSLQTTTTTVAGAPCIVTAAQETVYVFPLSLSICLGCKKVVRLALKWLPLGVHRLCYLKAFTNLLTCVCRISMTTVTVPGPVITATSILDAETLMVSQCIDKTSCLPLADYLQSTTIVPTPTVLFTTLVTIERTYVVFPSLLYGPPSEQG
jgi:hypothetical protein